MEDNEQKQILVNIGVAALIFGVNPQTIRRAVKNREIAYIIVDGRYKINFESLVKWSQEKTTIKNKLNTRGIGQFVEQWRVGDVFFSPRTPRRKRKNQKSKI